MNGQSKEIIPDNDNIVGYSQSNKENEEISVKTADIDECSDNSRDEKNYSVSVSMANTETSSCREIINKDCVVIDSDHNNIIVNNSIENNNKCSDTNIEIVSNNNKEIIKDDDNKEIIKDDGNKEIIKDVDNKEIIKDDDNQEIIKDDDNKEIIKDDDNEKRTNYSSEIDKEIKVEHFDAYEDEKNKIYRKYNLRKAVKSKAASLNEDKLFQHLHHQFVEINSKRNLKKHKQLNKTDPNRSRQNRETENKPNRYYSCDLCPETFETKYFLICHKERHGNKNIYFCFYCHKDFEKNIDLIEHKKVHKNERCFSCSRCEMAFSSEISYLKHTYNHSKPPYKCQECLFVATQIGTIKAHVSLHSDSNKECNICNKIVHERKKCNHESFECGECGKIVTSKSSFDYHMISHTGVKRKQCLYCGKAFVNMSQVKVHTTIHTDLRAYECNICHMKFRQQCDLKRHTVVHFDKRFECDYCGKKFLHKESIVYHIRLHTNYKPYKCPECPMSFVTSTHLTSHTYIVHLGNTFSCDTCNMKFGTKEMLNRHMRCISHRNKLFGSNLKGSSQ